VLARRNTTGHAASYGKSILFNLFELS